ncbi:helix-turn-helix domain-containing protein [Piscibacillus halophilus]|uniref:Helix-turn-helix domain-containing protein n=1 Tax=Piscibacillus halophilus TaxID=571933 RepID=A0A1H9FXX5_9BACI|nr:helix-turn-helix domain-containing protein [Piscibacillus halophilus]SEQ42358.1 Helix-turn-helix domain-containing protein [Piscibacillus halophilus]
MDPREEIGKRIYELRKYFKITQKELCEGICTQAYISKIENGSLAIAADILFEIAERLGVDINYFYDSSYNPRVDYALEVELEARNLVKKDEFEKLEELIKREEKTPLMYNNKFKQFILWHKAIYTRYIYDDFERAESLLDEALTLFNTSSKSYSEREIHILINKANLHTDKRNFAYAIELYEKAKATLEKLPYLHDDSLVTLINFNLARTHYLKGEFDKTILYSENGIQHCKKKQSLDGFGQFHFLKGNAHRKLKNFSLAKKHVETAMQIFALIDHEKYLSNCEKVLQRIKEEVDYTTS